MSWNPGDRALGKRKKTSFHGAPPLSEFPHPQHIRSLIVVMFIRAADVRCGQKWTENV